MAEETRRDFMVLATGAMAGTGVVIAGASAVANYLQPSNATLAAGKTKVDVSAVAPGSGIKVSYRKQVAFVRRRTAEEIATARADNGMEKQSAPSTDEARTSQNYLPDGSSNAPGNPDEWLVLMGKCTHLGCVPTGTAVGEMNQRGEFGGWFCPCHGSHYDTSGRIRKGPAPANLKVPDYRFDDKGILVLGESDFASHADAA